MFFIGQNCLVKDKENLFLSMKLAKGKGFSDKVIHFLLKKEYHIPTCPLELKEQLWYIMVFHSLFNGIGRSTKEIKKISTPYQNGNILKAYFSTRIYW